jgi:hypothetical protein
MKFQTATEALAVLQDTTRTEVERTAAIQALLHAMKGAGADAATPQAAFQLLRSEEMQTA